MNYKKLTDISWFKQCLKVSLFILLSSPVCPSNGKAGVKTSNAAWVSSFGKETLDEEFEEVSKIIF